jgi:hypothetical protein
MAYPDTKPREGDDVHVTHKKILQRLNTGLTVSGTAPDGGLESASLTDAFGRLQVSNPVTLFDSKHDVSNQDDDWFYSAPYQTDADDPAAAVLHLNASANTTIYRQTYRRFAYQPGKAQSYLFTFKMQAVENGLVMRVGSFDTKNGLFFEIHGGFGVRFGIRRTGSSTTNTYVNQADWNVDKLDGTGISGKTLDVSKVQILSITYEWLGVGTVFFGFFIDGEYVLAHKQNHANVGTNTYTATPNFPIRYEASNDSNGPAVDLYQYCSSVVSEGGLQITGHLRHVDRGSTGLTTLNDADLYPLIALKHRDTEKARRATLLIDSLSITCVSTTTQWRWALIKNPTVTGTALSYANAGEASSAAVGATNATKVSGGTLLASGYAVNTATNLSNLVKTLNDVFLGYNEATSTADFVVLAVQRITGTTETFYGGIGFREVL